MDVTELPTVITEELPILITVASNFVKNQGKPAPFHIPIFFTSANLLLRELKAVFFDHQICSALEFIAYASTSMSHTRMKSIFLMQMFLSYMHPHNYDPMHRKRS